MITRSKTLQGSLMVCVIWQVLHVFLNPQKIPSPFTTFFTLWNEIVHGNLLLHVGISMMRIFVALFFHFSSLFQ